MKPLSTAIISSSVMGVFLLVGMNLFFLPKQITPMDMLHAHDIQSGLFVPHSNNCVESEAFVALTADGRGYCIEKEERQLYTWQEARMDCAKDGKRLPEPFEWKVACSASKKLGLKNMIGNWEWASSFTTPEVLPVNNTGDYQGMGVPVFGNQGCHQGTWEWIGHSKSLGENGRNFRCVR
mgnify:CR=1 FL=1